MRHKGARRTVTSAADRTRGSHSRHSRGAHAVVACPGVRRADGLVRVADERNSETIDKRDRCRN
jgi:hypothetical protein